MLKTRRSEPYRRINDRQVVVNAAAVLKKEDDFISFQAEEAQSTVQPNMQFTKIISHESFIQGERIAYLEKELKAVQGQLKELAQELISRNDKIARLTSQLIESSLKTAEGDILIKKKDQKLIELNDEMDDFQSRLSLSQKMIGEKDDQIDSMQRSLVALQKLKKRQASGNMFSEVRNNVKYDKFEELSGILKIYKSELIDAKMNIRIQSEDISDLVNQLEVIHEKLNSKNRVIDKTKKDFNVLKRRVYFIQKEYKSLKNYSKLRHYNRKNFEHKMETVISQLQEINILLEEI